MQVPESSLPPALQFPWAAERDKAGAFRLTAEQARGAALLEREQDVGFRLACICIAEQEAHAFHVLSCEAR